MARLSFIQIISVVTVALVLGTFVGLNITVLNLTGLQNQIVVLNKEIITLKEEIFTLKAEIIELKDQLVKSKLIIAEQQANITATN